MNPLPSAQHHPESQSMINESIVTIWSIGAKALIFIPAAWQERAL
jgi:hypothetical protein